MKIGNASWREGAGMKGVPEERAVEIEWQTA